jgi:class 3 adenylate cyclase
MVEMFEELTQRYDLEKIKTIGDSYMTTGGLLRPLPNPVLNCIQCGLEMVAVAPTLPTQWKVRVGIHVGPVVAGVVGRRQYLFDVWGDTVNTAARIEGVGVPNAVNISGDAWKQVAELVQGESRGLMNIRGKGDLELFRVDSIKLA